MKRPIACLLVALSPLAVQASDLGLYSPLGSTGFGVGAALGLSTRFDLRLEYAGGTFGRTGLREGVDFQPRHGLNELAVVGDWYPLADSGFRLGTGFARSLTPYVGVGWGTRASQQRGLGLRADLGVTYGRADAAAAPGGLSANPAALDPRLGDPLDRTRIQPRFSSGIDYRF